MTIPTLPPRDLRHAPPETLTPAEIALLAADHEGLVCSCGCPDGGPDSRVARDYVWAYVAALPLSELAVADADKWRAWYDTARGDRFMLSRGLRSMERWWADHARRAEEPLTLVADGDGRLHLWDGAHRVGFTHTLGDTTVPAFVGRRRPAA